MAQDDGIVGRLRQPIYQTYMPASSEPDGDALEQANAERAEAADRIEALEKAVEIALGALRDVEQQSIRALALLNHKD